MTSPNFPPGLTDWMMVISTTVAAVAAIASVVVTNIAARIQRIGLDYQALTANAGADQFLVGIMEDARTERHLLDAFIKDRRSSPDLKPSDAVLEAADKVCRRYDLIGYLYERHSIYRTGVEQMYGRRWMHLYKDFLKEYIDNIRKDRGEGHFRRAENLYVLIRDKEDEIVADRPSPYARG